MVARPARRTAAGRRRRRTAPGPGTGRTGRPGRPGGRRRPRWLHPRPGPGATPRRPSSSRSRPRSPTWTRAGWTRAALGGLAEDHPQRIAPGDVADRQGRIVGAHRPGADQDRVALGPQAVGVGPGRGPVIHWLEPSGAAMRPSRVAASLSTTHGRPVGGASGRGAARPATSAAHTPTATSMPASRSRSMPRAARPVGPDPRCRRRPGARPAATRASAHGGVRPWWEQGSRVT